MVHQKAALRTTFYERVEVNLGIWPPLYSYREEHLEKATVVGGDGQR